MSWRKGENDCNGVRCADNAVQEKFKFDRFEELTPLLVRQESERQNDFASLPAMKKRGQFCQSVIFELFPIIYVVA